MSTTTKTPIEMIRMAAAAALSSAEQLVPDWLPEGSRRGTEWVAVNQVRADRAPGSFSINLLTGKWNDFADAEARGKDLVALLAYLRNCDQLTAAREICRTLGILPAANETPAQQQQRQAAIAQQQAQRKAALEKAETRRADAQNKARLAAKAIWEISKPADSGHHYLAAKRINPYRARQDASGCLLVPLQLEGQLLNLQMISQSGRKRFLTGGRVKGCYALIGKHQPAKPLYICEGWSTGATIHAETGCLVFCAMSAGNLLEVARYVREKTGPQQKIIIAGDDDRNSKGNPGRTAANAAAEAIAAETLYPEWPEGSPSYLSDFNDLHCWHAEQVETGGGHE